MVTAPAISGCDLMRFHGVYVALACVVLAAPSCRCGVVFCSTITRWFSGLPTHTGVLFGTVSFSSCMASDRCHVQANHRQGGKF